MTTLIVFVVVLVAFVIIWKRVYFKPISAVLISPSIGVTISTFRPSRRFFRGFGAGFPVSFVRIAKDVMVVHVDNVDMDVPAHLFGKMFFKGDIYLVKVGFLGRFGSVDLSDRRLSSIISNFERV